MHISDTYTLSRSKKPEHHRTSRAQLRPMAVRVVHKLQHYTLGVARWTASKPHTRARAHPKQVVAQRCAIQSVVPRPRRRAHCRSHASGGTSRAAGARDPGAIARAPCRPRAPSPLPSQSLPSDRPAPRECTARRRGCPHAASPPCTLVPIRMLHKLVSQLSA